MNGAKHRFRVVSEPHEGVWRRLQMIKCCQCGYDGKLVDSSNDRLPPEMVAQKFRQRGWKVGSNASGDVCPKCAGAKKKPLTPAQKRAAFCKIAGVPRAQPDPQVRVIEPTKEETVMTAAAQPQQPTPADRRRVSDALEEHYLTEKGCYRDSFSDEALAAKLDVPRAWVTELRELLFGPGAGNEAREKQQEEFKALRAEFEDASGKIMTMLDGIEKRLKKLEIDRSYAA